MITFLEEVASHLYTRYGEGLSERTLLFPSRRARLFFVDALTRIAGRPMWQPQWAAIEDLMSEISGLHSGDRLRLIAELYRVYSQYHNEPFDKFYFWGDMLLSDFDTIDKYRIDAEMLFRNLSDLKELEADISYLTPAQLRILSFWSSLGSDADLSEEKRRFLAIWKTLLPVYNGFRERLKTLGIAYNGMMQRSAVEKIEQGTAELPDKKSYAIIGFNALTECEKRLFKYLSTSAECDFFWDWDNYYRDNGEQEAGLFVRDNLLRFPPAADISHDNMGSPKEVTAVSCLSNAVQCKYVAKIVAEKGKLGKETAIVLTDENLLLPLLYALPKEIGEVNVTMGFPLRQSLAYTFVERLIGLQSNRRSKGFYHVDVTGILSHPYINETNAALTRSISDKIKNDRLITVDAEWLGQNELLKQIFTPVASWSELSDYLLSAISSAAKQPYRGDDARQRVEFLAVIAEEIAKLRNSLCECDIEITTEIYTSLLRRYMQTVRIPFEGEPLEGVQVMGILETRNLDFENVIILSMNDDNFPGSHVAQSSFIPYNLRAAYDLPTPEHHEAVYAYYFYRLIQRAERVHLLYCSHADEKTTGEPSRYIYQLDYESNIDVKKVEVGVDVNLAESKPIEVAKDEAVMQSLERFIDTENEATLSPTAFFRYVACPMRFYFHSIARLESEDNLSEEVDAPMFGTILHSALQRLYARIVGDINPGETLRAMILSGEVERTVEEAINREYLQKSDVPAEDYSGNLLLIKDIVTRYLRNGVMPYDAAYDNFIVSGVEEKISYSFPFKSGERELQMKFSGISDRIDTLSDGALRVVDYKSGAAKLEFDGLENLFKGKGKQRLSNILQTLLYSMMLHHTRKCDVEPALYYVREINKSDYSPQLRDKELSIQGGRYSQYKDRFEELLRTQLSEMYDSSTPFRQCEDADTCTYCDFNSICRR